MSITVHHSIKNTSGKYLLVGNASEVIAAYESAASAAADIDSQVPCIDASRWAAVRVLAPGEAWECELSAPLPLTADEHATSADESKATLAAIFGE